MVKKGNPKRKSRKDKALAKTKKGGERIHATRRLAERYGEAYTADLRNTLIKMIQNNQTAVIENQSNRVKKHLIIYNNNHYVAIYDKQRKEIVTFLPSEQSTLTF